MINNSHNQPTNTKQRIKNTGKRLFLLVTLGALSIELTLLLAHWEWVVATLRNYLWLTPLIFFKTMLKRLMMLNLFGLFKVIMLIFSHALKLLIIKLLKTAGIRYGAFFSQRQWKVLFQYFRIIFKKIIRQLHVLKSILQSMNRYELILILIVFSPLFIMLFLLGVGTKMTREVMVKKGGEIGVGKVAISTAEQSRGLVAMIKRLDTWILAKIKSATHNIPK